MALHSIAFPCPTIVFTGAPGSGKTTAMLELGRELSGVITLAEAATAVFSHHGVDPAEEFADVETLRAFQFAVFLKQLGAERLLAQRARAFGSRGAILDRGLNDGDAYLPDGYDDLHRLTDVSRNDAFARYTAVVYFAPAPREVYDAVMRSKSARGKRHESYEQAVERGGLLREAWVDHPGFVEVDGPDWPEKLAAARAIVLRHLTTPPVS